MCADFGKGKILQARSSGAARILCFLQRLLHWLHCCGIFSCWRLNTRRMPPKGAKAALSAGREKRFPGSNGGSLAEDLVNPGNVGLLNDGKMEAARLATPRDKEAVQSDKFFSLSDHSSWSSNEQSNFKADKISPEQILKYPL
ncbi:hypothetical protein NDU88_006317 [Pleurodeles waltl]|uniref:Uncharacterized protein n=1 Tax=Pleurodeles waltl TaxID=8319 RepID=A0AAV7QH92_PLEWA|nr:hypothetical protein NDU88_006317 [Pleurodeles waltl]